MKFRELLEKFTDIGKLSDEQLKKGQKLDPQNDNFIEVDARVFYQAITRIKQNDIAKGDKAKGLDTLTIYSVSEYKNKRCFLGNNNSSGYALGKDGELVSVFSTQGSSGKAIVQDAIRNGAKYLDCFAFRIDGKISGQLFDLYSKSGFKIDKGMNSGKPGEAYSIQNGVSDFVDDNENVHPEDPRVVIFMKI